jgi:hypothetical protein
MADSELLLYQTEDGQTKIDVRLEDETVWLSQFQMAELFQTTKQNISLHIKNIFDEGELQENSTVKEYLTVQTEGIRKKVICYQHKPSLRSKAHWQNAQSQRQNQILPMNLPALPAPTSR